MTIDKYDAIKDITAELEGLYRIVEDLSAQMADIDCDIRCVLDEIENIEDYCNKIKTGNWFPIEDFDVGDVVAVDDGSEMIVTDVDVDKDGQITIDGIYSCHKGKIKTARISWIPEAASPNPFNVHKTGDYYAAIPFEYHCDDNDEFLDD